MPTPAASRWPLTCWGALCSGRRCGRPREATGRAALARPGATPPLAPVSPGLRPSDAALALPGPPAHPRLAATPRGSLPKPPPPLWPLTRWRTWRPSPRPSWQRCVVRCAKPWQGLTPRRRRRFRESQSFRCGPPCREPVQSPPAQLRPGGPTRCGSGCSRWRRRSQSWQIAPRRRRLPRRRDASRSSLPQSCGGRRAATARRLRAGCTGSTSSQRRR